MIVDVAGELRLALAAAGLEGEALDRRIEAAVERALARQSEQLQPLAVILGVSPRAALGRLSRDPELRALGLRCGRRLVFRRGEVEALLSSRQRDRTGGGR